MKALRTYFLMSLVWVLTGLALVACSDKATNNGSQCNGQIVDGKCDPTNPGSGGQYPPGGYQFLPNGDITNNSKFRDFNYRLFNEYAYCSYSTPYSCSDIQAKVQKINSTEYYVYLTSTSIGSYQTVGRMAQTVRLQATKFTYDGDDQEIFEIYFNNPYKYVIAELIVHQGLGGSASYYTLNFKDNSSSRPMANGEMRKGRDY